MVRNHYEQDKHIVKIAGIRVGKIVRDEIPTGRRYPERPREQTVTLVMKEDVSCR